MLSDTYHDFAEQFKEEALSYFNNPEAYPEGIKERVLLVYELMINECAMLDAISEERLKKIEQEQNAVLEKLKLYPEEKTISKDVDSDKLQIELKALIEEFRSHVPGDLEKDTKMNELLHVIEFTEITERKINTADVLIDYVTDLWNELPDPDNPHYEAMDDYAHKIHDHAKNFPEVTYDDLSKGADVEIKREQYEFDNGAIEIGYPKCMVEFAGHERTSLIDSRQFVEIISQSNTLDITRKHDMLSQALEACVKYIGTNNESLNADEIKLIKRDQKLFDAKLNRLPVCSEDKVEIVIEGRVSKEIYEDGKKSNSPFSFSKEGAFYAIHKESGVFMSGYIDEESGRKLFFSNDHSKWFKEEYLVTGDNNKLVFNVNSLPKGAAERIAMVAPELVPGVRSEKVIMDVGTEMEGNYLKLRESDGIYSLTAFIRTPVSLEMEAAFSKEKDLVAFDSMTAEGIKREEALGYLKQNYPLEYEKFKDIYTSVKLEKTVEIPIVEFRDAEGNVASALYQEHDKIYARQPGPPDGQLRDFEVGKEQAAYHLIEAEKQKDLKSKVFHNPLHSELKEMRKSKSFCEAHQISF